MDRPISAVRNTCFAILSGVECDLRELIGATALNTGDLDIMPDDVRAAALPRFVLDNKEKMGAGPENDLDLLHYTDFADLSKMLNRRSKELSAEYRCDVGKLAINIERMAGARNRVCHSRPLEEEDLHNFLDLAKMLLAEYRTIPWNELQRIQDIRQRDPSYVLRLEIPHFWQAVSERIHHNLPLPDFDETSFLGRVSERRELKKLLLGTHPVVSIVGEGGIGKSALAIEACYELLDYSGDTRYEAIVWVSLKMRTLTASGIKDIRNSVTDTIGVIQTATESLGANSGAVSDLEALTSELLDYMQQFRVLLVIDNFETLNTNALRPVLSEVPVGSKVLITSRIGMGELEIRYKLDALDSKTAVALLRRSARCLNLDLLSSASDARAEKYCTLLYRNPLLIKWYVQSVASGSDPDRIVSKGSQAFDAALRFCFENLFSRLQDEEKQVLHLLASTRRGLTQTELLFLLRQVSESEQPAIESALATLHNSSMLRRTAPDPRGAETTSQIVLTDVASEYLQRFAAPDRKFFEKVQTALKYLRELAEKSSVEQETYRFDLSSIHAGTRDQRIVAAYLKQALDNFRDGNIEFARKSIEKAKELLPNYSEIYRISALIETKAGDYYKVVNELETAITYNPNSTVAHYQYGLFLIREMKDSSQALDKFEKALEIEPNNATLLTQRALALTWLGRCKEAALIYEQVMKGMTDWPRKWRVSTRHQAAECYRRLAEQDDAMKDSAQLKVHLDRACHIIEEAWGAMDSDRRMVDLYANIIEDGILHSAHSVDEAYAVECLERLSDATYVGDVAPFNKLTYENFENSFGAHSAPVARARQLSERIVWAKEKTEERKRQPLKIHQGEIKALPSGLSYGFILDTEGRDWFFHKSSLSEGKRWSSLRVGEPVRFQETLGDSGRLMASRVEVTKRNRVTSEDI
jgi:LuxR family glucitol operon transcriptional activator